MNSIKLINTILAVYRTDIVISDINDCDSKLWRLILELLFKQMVLKGVDLSSFEPLDDSRNSFETIGTG